MSGWDELQLGIRITIIYLLLLLSMSASANVNKMKQLARPPLNPPHSDVAILKRTSGSRVDIPRLYTAYKVRVMENSGNDKINVGEIGKRTALAEEEEDESTNKRIEALKESAVTGIQSTVVKHLKEKVKDVKSTKLSTSSAVKNDATDDHKVGNSESVHIEKIEDVKGKQYDTQKVDVEIPVVEGMVILKMDTPKKINTERLKTTDTLRKPLGNLADLDSSEQRIAELNRIYKEFVDVWKKPIPESRAFNLLGERKKFPATPIHLNALNELMNVVENLQQSNPMDDIVKAINDEMNPNAVNKLAINGNLASPGQNQEKTKRICGRSLNIFKHVAPKDDSDMKTGGLYEEYKKRLSKILQAHKQPRKCFIKEEKVPIQSNTSTKRNQLTQCHCDEVKPVIMAVDSDGPKICKDLTPCQCEATRPASLGLEGNNVKIFNTLVPCHCAAMKGPNMADVVNSCAPDARTSKPTEYLKDLETSMQTNKENNLNGGLKPYYLSNSKQRQMVWNDVPLIRPGSPRKTEVVKTQILTAPKSGAKQTSTGTKSRKPNVTDNRLESKAKAESAPTDSDLSKCKDQLQHILKVFQAKHRLENIKKGVKRGLMKSVNGVYNTPANLGFPEVLVNKFAQAPEAGGKMIETMAKQLNVSPLEMAQRIASPGGQTSGTFPEHSNIASQTIGCQVPMATSNFKTAPSATITATGQQGQSGNIEPMLEKILTRLQIMQETKSNEEATEKLPCCFANPTDGAPCELTGSWESLLLGIRINIRDEHKVVIEPAKPPCVQPKFRRSDTSRLWRQCVKLTPTELKTRLNDKDVKELNITIQDTLPPRPHVMMDNLSDWSFTGHAVNTLGGPITLNCRKFESSLTGTFVGFCRKCGCIDTLFGSWTFCLPSRDCQDITMSIFERRDILRRFMLDEARKERLKEHLYVQKKTK